MQITGPFLVDIDNLSKIIDFEQIEKLTTIWNASENLRGLKFIGDLIQTLDDRKVGVELELLEVARILFDPEIMNKYYNISTFKDIGDFKEKDEAKAKFEKFEPIDPVTSFLARYQECDIIKIMNDEDDSNLYLALENLNAQILPDNIRTAINDIVKELGWAVENEGQPESLGDTSVMTESFEESKESSDCSRQDVGEISVQALGDIQIHNEYEANI